MWIIGGEQLRPHWRLTPPNGSGTSESLSPGTLPCSGPGQVAAGLGALVGLQAWTHGAEEAHGHEEAGRTSGVGLLEGLLKSLLRVKSVGIRWPEGWVPPSERSGVPRLPAVLRQDGWGNPVSQMLCCLCPLTPVLGR